MNPSRTARSCAVGVVGALVLPPLVLLGAIGVLVVTAILPSRSH